MVEQTSVGSDIDQKSALPLKAAYTFGAAHGLEKEVNSIREMEVEWDSSYTSTVRRGYVVALFQQHGLLAEFIANHWPYGTTPSGQTLLRRYESVKNRFEDFSAGIASTMPIAADATEPLGDVDALSFSLEYQLQDFLAQNIEAIPVDGKRLALFVDQSGRKGVEYPTDVGRIDILATDKDGAFVVFELKRALSPDHAIGQLARYMGWVKQKLANGREVHGVIVAKEIGDRLRFALTVMPNVSLFEYEVAFNLRPAAPLN